MSIDATQNFINEVKGCVSNRGNGGDGSTDLTPVYNEINTVKSSLNSHTSNDEEHTTMPEMATTFSNPNLLDNADFRINQRGITSCNEAGYTVDRWILSKMSTVSSLGTVEVADNGITLVSNAEAQSVRFMQKMEKDIPEGEIVTISVYVEYVEGNWRFSQFGGEGRGNIDSLGWNTFTTTWTYAYETSQNAVVIYNDSQSMITISKIKLELGSQATKFIPPNPAEELIKCCRYAEVLKGTYAQLGTGLILGTSAAWANVSILPKRVNPTVTISGTVYVNTASKHAGNAMGSTAMSSAHTYQGSVLGLPLAVSAESGDVGQPCVIQFRDPDSYILISADL